MQATQRLDTAVRVNGEVQAVLRKAEPRRMVLRHTVRAGRFPKSTKSTVGFCKTLHRRRSLGGGVKTSSCL